MPNNSPAGVREPAEPDPRVLRTTQALGEALITLIQERDLAEITVQQVLDRAGVGRTTFYAHYRNKEDVLHSSYERLFSAFDGWLEQSPARGARLFPVAELLEHVGSAQGLADALRRSQQIETFWALCMGHAERLIGRRLAALHPRGTGPGHHLTSRMLAGALVASLRWWQEHPERATPSQVDAAFHELARGVLLRSG